MMIMRDSGHTGNSHCFMHANDGNTMIKADAYGVSSAYPSSTNTLVRHLNKGDTVSLHCYNVAYMSGYSSFSGVLIQPDDVIP